MGNLANLDGIRAIAVTLVVVSHLLLQMTAGESPAFYNIKTMGRMGVAIFFVHTTLVLMASLEHHGSSTIPFYVRRVFRIYPLSVAMVLFLALLQALAHVPVDTYRLLSNLFLVQNITNVGSRPLPLWTLPFEMQMYLVLPVLFVIARSRHAVTWISLLIVLCACVVLLAPADSLVWRLFRFVPSFLPGVLAYILSRRAEGKKHPVILFGIVILAGVICIPMLVASGLPELPLMWILCLAIGLAIPVSRQLNHGYFTLSSKVIAKYSYGIYLTHVFALGVLDDPPNGPTLFQFVAMIILLPGLAYVAYHCIEKHGIALGVRLADHLQKRERKGVTTSRLSPDSGSG
jgi:peptidoglycan/LPS O-acetylase OafA/YrhL